MKKYLLLILDGAGDLARFNGLTPLQLSKLDNINKLSSKGFGGLMETLYDDLPKGSIVAQLGILGYDPYKYYPNGRASCEGLALGITYSSEDQEEEEVLEYGDEHIVQFYLLVFGFSIIYSLK